MTNSHTYNIIDYLDPYLKRISEDLFLRKSLLLLSKHPQNSHLLLNLIFNDYDTRTKYLKRQKDDFILLDLGSVSKEVLANIDDFILNSMTLKILKDFYTLADLKVYLSENGYVMVLHLSKFNFDRSLFSYKYIFGENVIFIYSSDKEDYIFDDTIHIQFDESFLRIVINERLEELNIDLDINEIINNLDGNISKIDNEIFNLLNKKRQDSEEENIDLKELQSEDNEYPVQQNHAITNSDIIADADSEINVVLPTELLEEQKEQVLLETDLSNTEEKIPVLDTKHVIKSSNSNVNLTSREQKIIEKLNTSKKISRDEIAEIVWGEEAQVKANADAIDQIISRLRKKFVNAGYDRSYITSIKGEGVVLQ